MHTMVIEFIGKGGVANEYLFTKSVLQRVPLCTWNLSCIAFTEEYCFLCVDLSSQDLGLHTWERIKSNANEISFLYVKVRDTYALTLLLDWDMHAFTGVLHVHVTENVIRTADADDLASFLAVDFPTKMKRTLLSLLRSPFLIRVYVSAICSRQWGHTTSR
jgi:hypothetical protein